MWEKIVLNLISNAFKFTFEGEIKVSLRLCGEKAEFSVSDTGEGIPSDELSRIFDRFHRVRGTRSRTHEGTGIGLSLVQELARLSVAKFVCRALKVRDRLLPLPSRRTGPTRLKNIFPGRRMLTPTRLGAMPFVEEALRWLPKGRPRPPP